MSAPFLSVVIPTYNRCASLRRTLDGLARQEGIAWESVEVVVVSDGATDQTEAMLAQYAQTAPFTLRPIRQDNAGPARARNRGVEEARGEVIVFVDDDIEPMPGFLAAHKARHEGDPRLVVVGPQSPAPDRRAHEPVWIAWEHEMLQRQYACFDSGKWTAGPPHFYTGNASLRREYLRAVGGFDETFKRQEDVEFAYRVRAACGLNFVYAGDTQALHRPSRTYESWAKTPYAYGQLDIVRAQRGDVSWRLIWMSYQRRNRLTRLLVDLIVPRPALSPAVGALLSRSARIVFRLPGPGRKAAIGLLSMVYNVRYMEGARDSIGGWNPLAQVIRLPESDPRVAPPAKAS